MKNKQNKFSLIILCIFILLFICGCSDLKITEDMQQAIDVYTQAVAQSETRSEGKVVFNSVTDDKALEFKRTQTTVNFEYTVKNGAVCFTRSDFLDGTESAKYRSDGSIVEKFDYSNSTWVDVTEENKDLLKASANPFITLSLFRVDNKLRLRTDYLKDITMTDENGVKVITFTLKDKTVSDVLAFYKADGIVRESAGHTRKYYISSDGYIEKIIINTTQQIITNGTAGEYITEMVVECK